CARSHYDYDGGYYFDYW
nr:immunoglobulin heavy chain junction region [Mus musculus]